MDRGIYGWIVNTTHENFWRVAGWYDFEDLVQDGFLHYHRIVTKYSNVREPKQIMALFKVCFTNHIHDLSKKRTRSSEEGCDDSVWATLESAISVNPDTSALIAQLPPVLRSLIVALQSDSRVRRPCRRREYHRETTNEKLCRIVGADPRQINLLEALRVWLSTETPQATTV